MSSMNVNVLESEKPVVEPAIVCCSGFADSGGIAVVSPGLRMWEIAEATVPGLEAVWSLGSMGILISGPNWTKLMQVCLKLLFKWMCICLSTCLWLKGLFQVGLAGGMTIGERRFWWPKDIVCGLIVMSG